MSIACAHPSKWTTGPIITLWVFNNKYFNINKYNLFTVDKIIHRVLPWLRMLAVKLQLIEIEGTLWEEAYIFHCCLYLIDIFCTRQVILFCKILIVTFSCRVICAVIACLCLAGTAVDLLVVQGSWKFWVTAEEPRQAEESDFRISSNQTEPLLINNGLSESTGLRSVQYMQPSLEERGNCS